MNPAVLQDILVERQVLTRTNRFYPIYSKEGAQKTDSNIYTRKTKLCCHWCTEPINAIPYPMGVEYKETKQTGWWFVVAGIFCSPACSLAGAFEATKTYHATQFMFHRVYGLKITTRIKRDVIDRSNFAQHKQQQLDKGDATSALFKKAHDIYEVTIRPAPSRLCLKKFGGHMSIEEFRGSSYVKNLELKETWLPFVQIHMGIEEIEHEEKRYALIPDSDMLSSMFKDELKKLERQASGHVPRSFLQNQDNFSLRLLNRENKDALITFSDHPTVGGGSRGRKRRTSTSGPAAMAASKPRRTRVNGGGATGSKRKTSSLVSGENNQPLIEGQEGQEEVPTNQKQQGHFMTYPSMQDLLEKSSRRLEEEKRQLALIERPTKKKPRSANLLNFMTPK